MFSDSHYANVRVGNHLVHIIATYLVETVMEFFADSGFSTSNASKGTSSLYDVPVNLVDCDPNFVGRRFKLNPIYHKRTQIERGINTQTDRRR